MLLGCSLLPGEAGLHRCGWIGDCEIVEEKVKVFALLHDQV
jgi:hypothetical protein